MIQHQEVSMSTPAFIVDSMLIPAQNSIPKMKETIAERATIRRQRQVGKHATVASTTKLQSKLKSFRRPELSCGN